MQIALIGLGRMGHNMAKRLMKDGHQLVVYDQSADARRDAVKLGAKEATTVKDLKTLLISPRVAWVMVPHGSAVDQVVDELCSIFEPGDIIIDGGNSHFLQSIERGILLSKQGINFLDVGVSGGVFGLERGYCLMVGGDQQTFIHVEPILKSLAPGENAAVGTVNRQPNHSPAHLGYLHCGPHGAGHYVKMVHNAIEYGMMQSYAEGFELLKNADAESLPKTQRFLFDVREISELWRRGSVINSWLLDLLAEALHKDPQLSGFLGHVPDSGEGRFALTEAIKQGTPAPNLANALFTRFRSRQNHPFAEKSLSALRHEFGGHQEANGHKK